MDNHPPTLSLLRISYVVPFSLPLQDGRSGFQAGY